IRTMRAFGAEVELIPSPDGITPDLIPAMMRRAAEITAQTGAFATDQFNNTDMVDGYRRLGEELLDQLPGPPAIGAFCSYVAAAIGVARRLGPGQCVVTIQVDSGLKYLAGQLYS